MGLGLNMFVLYLRSHIDVVMYLYIMTVWLDQFSSYIIMAKRGVDADCKWLKENGIFFENDLVKSLSQKLERDLNMKFLLR